MILIIEVETILEIFRDTQIRLLNLVEEEIEGGIMDCLFHQSPKFYNNVLVYIVLTTLGTFGQLVNQVQFLYVTTKNFNLREG